MNMRMAGGPCGHYVACNIILQDRFGGGTAMVWGRISLECRTDLHVKTNSTLTAVRYCTEIFRAMSDLMLVQWALGSSWCNAWPHVARVCRQFQGDKGIPSTGFLIPLN